MSKLSEAEQVAAYIAALDHPLKPQVETLRTIIKSAGPLSERIKWNAPSYYYKEDFVTFNLHDKKAIRLIFHHPSIVAVKSDILEGDWKDRRIVYIKNAEEASSKKAELERIIKDWLQIVGG
ncbi:MULTISPECIES: DUF1801 domain-containing protein [unclassified Imperialibacter]|uniref:DUF1801 domain-containing protein n=1 Tax=unclassified Imperialibacter TaxID=2629706 RepID=UPI00125853AF|nr:MULTISPECIES: DUF1801 domain-containing protein [unclassified Imperialibacter]CAD5262532.1 conserved hypothetical protein [Imperialibacter sp. 75]CAD5276067.1 conserved hypothetical protein [Imperialibacter sp. 89]VVT08725.1 conserved hypothetical protein [Imperialibacter sp. EC-SDR9]